MTQHITIPTDLGVCAVTGSSGWFASCLVSQLTQNGYKVHCLDIVNKLDSINNDINPYCKINKKLIQYFKCDLTKYGDLAVALKGVDTVFHVCSITDIRVCPSPTMYKVNVNGTSNVIKASRECNVKQLIYTSSNDAVVDGKVKDQATEKLKYVTNRTVYGATKALSEQLIIKASNNSNLAVSVLRISHIYGPGDPIMMTTSKYPIRIGSDKNKFSLIYIENCAYAHIQCAKALSSKEKRLQCDKQVFNIKDNDCNLITWYREILCGKSAATIWIPYFIAIILAFLYDYIVWIVFKLFGVRIGDPIESLGVLAVQAVGKEHTFCVDKYDKLIGYNPPVNIKEAIKRTREWRKHKYPQS